MKPLSIKLFSVLLLLLNTVLISGDEITKPINALFDAMRAKDAQKLTAQFTTDAILHRAQKDGTVTTTDIAKFAENVAKSSRYLDEHLLAYEIHQSGNLASVWTPFVFYLDKKLSHCGINSFQLVKQGDSWKIHYLIDNAFQGDCEEFIKRYN